MTATGVEAGSRRAPNASQRSAVSASIDQPWIRLSGGRADAKPHTKATTAIATASRLVTLPIAMSGYRTAGLFQAHQTAADPPRARLGRAIDQENRLPRPQACRIGATRLQGRAGLGKIVELAPHDRRDGEVHIVPLAPRSEPFADERSASLGLHDRRKAVERQLRRVRNLAIEAADHRRGALADFPTDQLRMARVAFNRAGLDVAEMDHALFGADDHRPDPCNGFAPAGFHVTEHHHAARPKLDDFSRRNIVHEFSAGDLALHVFDDGNGRLRCSYPRKTNAADNRGDQTFHSGNPNKTFISAETVSTIADSRVADNPSVTLLTLGAAIACSSETTLMPVKGSRSRLVHDRSGSFLPASALPGSDNEAEYRSNARPMRGRSNVRKTGKRTEPPSSGL